MEEVRPLTLSVNGLSFSGLAAGPETGELVLLLHGFPQFADSWVAVMRSLAKAGMRVVAMDQRGYSAGARPREVRNYGIGLLVADVLGFADALGVERFHLAGHDWGGLVAWQAAADHPQRVATVSVLATPHPDAFRQALRTDLAQIYKSKYMLLFRAPGHLAEKVLLAHGAAVLRGVYQGKVAAEQVEENVRRLSEDGGLMAALNWYRALRWTGKTGRVAVPSLYVWGDADIALGEKAAMATAPYIDAPYRFERMVGGSHWLLEEASDRIAALLVERIGL